MDKLPDYSTKYLGKITKLGFYDDYGFIKTIFPEKLEKSVFAHRTWIETELAAEYVNDSYNGMYAIYQISDGKKGFKAKNIKIETDPRFKQEILNNRKMLEEYIQAKDLFPFKCWGLLQNSNEHINYYLDKMIAQKLKYASLFFNKFPENLPESIISNPKLQELFSIYLEEDESAWENPNLSNLIKLLNLSQDYIIKTSIKRIEALSERIKALSERLVQTTDELNKLKEEVKNSEDQRQKRRLKREKFMVEEGTSWGRILLPYNEDRTSSEGAVLLFYDDENFTDLISEYNKKDSFGRTDRERDVSTLFFVQNFLEKIGDKGITFTDQYYRKKMILKKEFPNDLILKNKYILDEVVSLYFEVKDKNFTNSGEFSKYIKRSRKTFEEKVRAFGYILADLDMEINGRQYLFEAGIDPRYYALICRLLEFGYGSSARVIDSYNYDTQYKIRSGLIPNNQSDTEQLGFIESNPLLETNKPVYFSYFGRTDKNNK